MPVDLFASVVQGVSDMMMAESGNSDGRSAVEREMRRLLDGSNS